MDVQKTNSRRVYMITNMCSTEQLSEQLQILLDIYINGNMLSQEVTSIILYTEFITGARSC